MIDLHALQLGQQQPHVILQIAQALELKQLRAGRAEYGHRAASV